MSEIEKLYKNAGIKKVRQTNIAGGDYPIAVGFEDYSPFTAEKQLKLLLFQINKGIKLEFKNESKTEKVQIEALTDCIAGLINTLWQDLSDKEKAEIREILK